MYDQYYGFTGRPFQLTPDPAFYFESMTHRKAMSYLGYGLAQGEGFIVITGDIGAGKTTLVGHLMATIDPRRLTAVKIVSTQVGGDDMLRLAAQGFGIGTDGVEKAQILARIEDFLQQQARAGKRSLLIVDEAQNLSHSALEELRMLSNFQLGGQSLLQIFLLGQPEFREMVTTAPSVEQLRQRIIAYHHLDPMQPDEVAPYIEHRLKIAGWQGKPRFMPDAYAMLAAESGGVPRRLNAMVSRVLLLGAIDHLDIIDSRVVEAVVADTGLESGARADSTDVVDELAPMPLFEDMPEIDELVDDAPEDAPALVLDTPVTAHPQPVVDAPAPFVKPDASTVLPVVEVAQDLDFAGLRAIRDEVDALNLSRHENVEATGPALSVAEPVATHSPALDERFDAIERRLDALERRSGEQDEVLRRVLAKLIEWAERDQQGPFAHRAA